MSANDKNLYIIAGCNGAGKTTAFRMRLSQELNNPEFVNPDKIAKNIDANNQWDVRISAGRATLDLMKLNIELGKTFCVETTLTSRFYASMIKDAQRKGYKVHLYYYWLESAEASYRRVLQRVREGQKNSSLDNHYIPEDIIRRRYPKSVDNLFNIFIPIVDTWNVYDNNLGMALPIADNDNVYDPVMWNIIQKRNIPVSSVNIERLVESGRRNFAETVLRDKLERNESVVYSIEGQVVEFTTQDVLWLYENLQRELSIREIELLEEKARLDKDQEYINGMHFPAKMVLKLYGHRE